MTLLRLISRWLPRPSPRLVLEPHERAATRPGHEVLGEPCAGGHGRDHQPEGVEQVVGRCGCRVIAWLISSSAHSVWASGPSSSSWTLASSSAMVSTCQPAAADSARTVRPASRRMSRSCSASCCLARWTLDDGELATVLGYRGLVRLAGIRRAELSVPRQPRRPPSTSGPLPCPRAVHSPGCDRRRRSTRTG